MPILKLAENNSLYSKFVFFFTEYYVMNSISHFKWCQQKWLISQTGFFCQSITYILENPNALASFTINICINLIFNEALIESLLFMHFVLIWNITITQNSNG